MSNHTLNAVEEILNIKNELFISKYYRNNKEFNKNIIKKQLDVDFNDGRKISQLFIIVKNGNGVDIKSIPYRISDYNKIKKALLEIECG